MNAIMQFFLEILAMPNSIFRRRTGAGLVLFRCCCDIPVWSQLGLGVRQAGVLLQCSIQAPLLVRLLLPSACSSASGASRFLLTRAALGFERGQSSNGLRFLTLPALRSIGDTGASSGSPTTI